MRNRTVHTITGAFGYTGKYIARELLAKGVQVETLTSRVVSENPFAQLIAIHPFNFDNPNLLTKSLKDTAVLYNTYWIRFDYKDSTFQRAVENTKRLFDCAREAGVEKVVHVSISNPSIDSPLPYFRGKAVLENALKESGLNYSILRPTVVFGKEDILINNIAWFLRHFPVFGMPGLGTYLVQPIFVEDLAKLAVQCGEDRDSSVLDAVGPEVFSFKEMIQKMSKAMGRNTRLIALPPSIALMLTTLAGKFLHDVILTKDEVKGLMGNLLVSGNQASCPTRFSNWIETHSDDLGRAYSSELLRHYS